MERPSKIGSTLSASTIFYDVIILIMNSFEKLFIVDIKKIEKKSQSNELILFKQISMITKQHFLYSETITGLKNWDPNELISFLINTIRYIVPDSVIKIIDETKEHLCQAFVNNEILKAYKVIDDLNYVGFQYNLTIEGSESPQLIVNFRNEIIKCIEKIRIYFETNNILKLSGKSIENIVNLSIQNLVIQFLKNIYSNATKIKDNLKRKDQNEASLSCFNDMVIYN